jgi:hypothetical protein
MRPVGRHASTIAILLLASCTAPLSSGRDSYADGMRALRYDPGAAGHYFAEGERDLGEALKDPDLDPVDHVGAVTLRARCLIELERHADASAQIAEDIKGYSPEKLWRGDLVGLALLKASRLDPERAYAELLLAEKKAATLRARVHLAWEEVHVLRKIGTPQAKQEGVKICEAHAGKIDFDALKQSLTAP